MKFMRLTGSAALAFVLLGVLARPVAAQLTVTSADIQRLDDSINEASRDVSQLRSRDASLASQLQSDLEDARDEATYQSQIAQERIDLARLPDLRARVENIRSRAPWRCLRWQHAACEHFRSNDRHIGHIQSSSSTTCG